MEIIYKIKSKFFPSLIKSDDYIQHLRRNGINVGKGTHFFGPCTTEVDIQRPWMLKIGEFCKITSGVKILCHDYSRSVLRRVYGDIIGEAGTTIVGNNVFIGINSIILMGSYIGDNVIIGAGSVVRGIIPSNCVIAGNPARVIRTLDEHYKMRRNKTSDEAKLWATSFYETYHRVPELNEMGPFWQLFMERNVKKVRKEKVFTNLNGDDEQEILSTFLDSKPTFESYEVFLEYCGIDSKL